MQILPAPLDKNQTLYSVIPLAIDMAHINQYLPHIETSYGDCQFFSQEEFPVKNFSYGKRSYQTILQEKNKKDITIPFSTLLVGTAFACKHIMTHYDEWAITHKNSLITSYEDNPQTKLLQHPLPSNYWTPITHPNVWSQATYSNVTTTCLFPQLLKAELQRMFDFPIEVNAIAPILSSTHNEFASWLTAIYALVAARNLYRTVLCHSRSWTHHQQFFVNHKAPTIPSLPKAWKQLVSHTMDITYNDKAKSQKSIDVITQRIQYDAKKRSYTLSNNTTISRIIGLGYSNQTLLPKNVIQKISKTAPLPVTLKYSANHASITIPFISSTRVLHAIQYIVAQKLSIPFYHIAISYKPQSNSDDISSLYHYSTLATVILKICEQITPTKRTRTIHSSVYAQRKILSNQYISVAVSIEFEMERYSNALSLHQAAVILDIGYITNKNHTNGMVEDAFYSTLFTLCGDNIVPKKNSIKPLSIDFINSSESSYTSSLYRIAKQASTNAIVNAIMNYDPLASFPLRRIKNV